MIRQTLTAFFAWATLVGGTCVLNAVAGFLLWVTMRRFAPELPEAAIWKTLALVFTVASPAWVLMFLKWFRQGPPARKA